VSLRKRGAALESRAYQETHSHRSSQPLQTKV
jgi:hypothetical protein